MSDSARKLWLKVCEETLAPSGEETWAAVREHSLPDTMWHSLSNCVSHQAGVWSDLLSKGVGDIMHPLGFELAILLRHTPVDRVKEILKEVLVMSPQRDGIIGYVVRLLTEDEAGRELPPRDRHLFGDLELVVLASSIDRYKRHARLVRTEYSNLSSENYLELRLKVLNQFLRLPKLFNSPEFSDLESLARYNMQTEILKIKEELSALRF